MRVDHSNERKRKEKKTCVKNIRYKNTFLNHFFTGQILPGCRVLSMEKTPEKKYLIDIKAREGFL